MIYAIGVDVGGTTISFGLVDKDYTVHKKIVKKMNSFGEKEEILNTILKPIKEFLSEYDIIGIGFAFPGPFDYEKGIAWMEHKFNSLYGFNVKEFIEKETGLDVYFENDASCFALGEYMNGAGKNSNKLIALTLGTGLGSASVIDGKVSDLNLWKLKYREGIFEDYVSGRGIIRIYKETGGKAKNIDGKKLEKLAKKGDKLAVETWLKFGGHIANGIDKVVKEIEPDVIVFGGQISKAFDLFSARIIEAYPDIEVKKSELMDDAAIIGAVYPIYCKNNK